MSKKGGYPKFLETSLKNKSPIVANRRGLTTVKSSCDKPLITISELVHMRKLGLSFKLIGKKLGIDCHRDGVIQVYKSLGIDNIEKLKAPAKVSPPTPMWYFFDSERELIKTSILPSPVDIKEHDPQSRIVSRLGENAGFMLDIFLKVGQIVNEEIISAYNGAKTNSPLGTIKKWDGDLGSAVIQQVYDIQKSVSRASYHLSDYFECEDIGRCTCAAIKSVHFGWKVDPIPYPSFFWGCSRYTPFDAGRHDRATPIRSTFWSLVGDEVKCAHSSDKNIKMLHQKTLLALAFWEDRGGECEEELLKHAASQYGGPDDALPFKSVDQVIDVLKGIRKDLGDLVDERLGLSADKNSEK